MLGSSGPFATMIDNADQVVAFHITMALPGGLYTDVTLAADAVDVQATTVTDLPQGTRLIEGYSSMQASFTLSGLVDQTDETKTAAWLFGRYSTTSPLYRLDAFKCAVTIDLGLYPEGAGGTPELIRKFTGYVDEYVENTDGSVAFTCIDRRSALRSAVNLPAVVTAPPFNAGLTSEFVLDYVLRQATSGTLGTWPAQRPQCLLAAGLRSSLWPEVGNFVSSQTTPAFKAGAFGSAYNDASLASPTYMLAAPVGSTYFFECWVTGLTGTQGVTVSVGDLSGTGGITVGLYADRIQLQTGTPVVVATNSSPHYFAALVTIPVGGTTTSATVWVDSTSRVLTFTGAARPSNTWQQASFGIVSSGTATNVTIEALQVTTEAAPTINYPFTPTAVLDPSLNPLQVIPATAGDPWSVIQQIAATELGVAGFDESGIFRFTNRVSLAGSALARTITSTAALKELGITSSAAAVVNRAQVGYTGWTFATTATTVYSLDTVTAVPPGGLTLTIPLDGTATNIGTTFAVLPNSSTDVTHSYYRASDTASGSVAHAANETITVVASGAAGLTLQISNASLRTYWLVSPATYTDVTVGTPLLRVAGLLVTQGNELVADYQYPPVAGGGAASARFGEVLFTSTGDPWSQDPTAATTLAGFIVADSCVPRPDLTGVDIVPDPRVQLSDRVLIVDPARSGVNEYGRIFGWEISYSVASGGGSPTYSMTIDARTIAAPGGWILGTTGRTELSTTTYSY